MKHMQRFKRVVTYAIRNLECLSKDPFLDYPLTLKKNVTVFLTTEELQRLISEKLEGRLDRVRDIFVFQCFTGLAYTDMASLRKENIDLVKKVIIKSREKTHVDSVIFLSDLAHRILQKYGYALPVSSNQKFNKYLKELATLCSVDKNLTTHVARHTFATTVTLGNGVPINIVSKMLGHSSIKMTEHYAKTSTSSIIRSGIENEKIISGQFTFEPDAQEDEST